MLVKNGFNRVMPSPNMPRPGRTDFYSGGFITRAHSFASDKLTNINVIQCELPYSVRTVNVNANARAFARSIYDFYNLHSFSNLR
jgi:hypothetical protein